MLIRTLRLCLSILALAACALLAGCAAQAPLFVPPADRALSITERPWIRNNLIVLAYHEVEDRDPDQTFVSVSTDHLIEQLAWLYENGYKPVSVDQILAAGRGKADLPDKAVLLTFDDGYRSFYTRVLPLLRAYQWPAVLAPVGSWLDTPATEKVRFGDVDAERERFLTWEQVREIAASGLVEIGAHTDNLHYGAPGNPQGNLQPAAAVRVYDQATQEYESDQHYQQRISKDVDAISGKIKRVTGKAPRVWVWPYGAENGEALDIVRRHGYQLALNLDDGLANARDLLAMPRLLISEDPDIQEFANAVMSLGEAPIMRVAHVDLDYVYDPDPAQMDRNLGALVQRIADLKISTVFLQAYADPQGDGLARSVYFPNRVLPMRADLFNRAAWQLMNRAFVKVYAWMPVLAFDLDQDIARVQKWDPASSASLIDAKSYHRLSPFHPKARRQITLLYEDLAKHAMFSGLLFHDDAVLSDFEDAGPGALAAYRGAGLAADIRDLRGDPAALREWTRYKSRYLVDFTLELAERVRAIRGPRVRTARNLYAPVIDNPASEAWFAQNLDDFLAAYDWTAVMAMPWMENVPEGRDGPWLDHLVDQVATRADALDKTVFELQARDWRPAPGRPDSGPIDTKVIAAWMKRLQLRGARSFGYYPDDFLQDQPELEVIRPALSNSWYPFR
ncbi:MAG: poly-beta-1,6-N-acetyl-D-glucosamine N-deacetylase PgaB [Candidimonas sp.]